MKTIRNSSAYMERLDKLLDATPCPDDDHKAERLARRIHRKAARDVRALRGRGGK